MDSIGPIKQAISHISTQIEHVAGRYGLTRTAMEKIIIPKADKIATQMLNPDAPHISKLESQPIKPKIYSHPPRRMNTGHISETPRAETVAQSIQLAKGVDPAEALLTLLRKSPIKEYAKKYYDEAMALQHPKHNAEVDNA